MQDDSKLAGWHDIAVKDGIKLARGIFALRGSHSEIHLKEDELASALALAFEHGIRAAKLSLTVELEESRANGR